eukprot:gnl/MRDRNA2_/MRDRNA2_83580_c0_seq3.p1 gnl/MRDRNA2_/MRDRNA2_83580_c0~~gnl/MRDRNA2_/MRDRNA2_83580_c0_seq3.p1  ORF type:complete len:863 (+),score=149.05 gnl/MRDRNA2_/MRDRNA2_83580_c0_seq3:151-2739(+)
MLILPHAAHHATHGHHHQQHQTHQFHVAHPPPPPAAEVKKLKPDERIAQEGIQQGIYLTWVKGELDNENACLELPFTIILLLSFSCLAVMHLRQDRVYSIEEAIEFDIVENANFAWAHAFGHKGIFDVNSLVDFWSWLRNGFVPLVVQQAWAYSESYPNDIPKPDRWDFYKDKGPGYQPLPVPGDYLHYNRIVGGLRFRQEIADSGFELCRVPGVVPADLWKDWYGKPCTTPKYQLTPDSDTAEAWDSDRSGRLLWLLTDSDTFDTMIETTKDMEDGCMKHAAKNRTCHCEWCANAKQPWLDELTQRIEISMLTYNPEYGLISMVQVNFFLDRGGFLHKFVNIQSAWVDIFQSPLEEVAVMLTCDFVWLGCLLYVFVSETREIIGVVRSTKSKWYVAIKEDYLGFWNCIDWLSIFVAFIVVVLYIRLTNTTQYMNAELQGLMSIRADIVGRAAYVSAVEQMYEKVEVMCADERMFRLSLCLYPMVVMARLFKSFAAQPRLAVVTATLVEAAQDMLHFFIVFTSVYVCMVVNGVLLFGQDVEDFATFDRAFHTCFRAMFGDWDWDALSDVGRFYAGLWFWLFLLIMVIILLNILLAVLMDAYACVKQNAGNAQTLPKQISEMIRRRRQFKQKQRVRLNDIWDAFFAECGDEKELLASENIIRPDDLKRKVKDIPASQAKRTMKNALDAFEKEQQQPYSLEEALNHIKQIEKRTQTIRDATKNTREKIDFYDELPIETPRADASIATDDIVVGSIKNAVGTLSTELATVLNGEMKFLEERQAVLEERQGEMLYQIKEMRHTLKLVHVQSNDLAKVLRKSSDQHRQQKEEEKMQLKQGQSQQMAGCASCVAPTTAQRQKLKYNGH